MIIIESNFLPKTENIKIQQNTTWNESWDFTLNGLDLNIEDSVPVIQIRNKADELLLEILLVSGLSLADNSLTVFKEISIELGKHYWELQVVLSTGYIVPVRKGVYDVRKNLIS